MRIARLRRHPLGSYLRLPPGERWHAGTRQEIGRALLGNSSADPATGHPTGEKGKREARRDGRREAEKRKWWEGVRDGKRTKEGGREKRREVWKGGEREVKGKVGREFRFVSLTAPTLWQSSSRSLVSSVL